MAETKIQILAVGEPQSGTNNGRNWNRVQLQIFTGQTACNHTVYGESLEELSQFKPGFYMASLNERAGNRGQLEFTLGELKPIPTK